MFTGIVEGCCPVADVQASDAGIRLFIDLGPLVGESGASSLVIGESISVSGCCLTLTEVSGLIGRFDVIHESLSKTTLGDAKKGERRNTERALRLSDRLGGHMVTGHVDGVGAVVQISDRGGERDITFSAPPPVAALLVGRGSITVDGVSLTIAECGPSQFRVALIPHTLSVTTLGGLAVGSRVNLEGDVLAKWVAELVSRGRIEPPQTMEELAADASPPSPPSRIT